MAATANVDAPATLEHLYQLYPPYFVDELGTFAASYLLDDDPQSLMVTPFKSGTYVEFVAGAAGQQLSRDYLQSFLN